MARAAVLGLLLISVAAAAPARKIYAAGSGHDMFALMETTDEVVELSGKAKPRVLYLGTATYDDQAAATDQTANFASKGFFVQALKVAYTTPSAKFLELSFNLADIVIVSGGNTLFAHDRWVKLGIDALMRKAMGRGVVLAGGSAGGIVWWDGGHSDSMDPQTYKNPPGPYVNPNLTKHELDQSWAYVRAPGLGMLPGLFCPHYDVTEGNGVLRATSFTNTLQHHAGETGVAVDNWGALVIDGDTYRVISRKGKHGSVGKDGQFTTDFSTGKPGAWLMTINATGELQRSLVPSHGPVSNILFPARYIAQDNILPVARLQNPDDGFAPTPPKNTYTV